MNDPFLVIGTGSFGFKYIHHREAFYENVMMIDATPDGGYHIRYKASDSYGHQSTFNKVIYMKLGSIMNDVGIYKRVILVAGLGGKTGGTLASSISMAACDQGIQSRAVVIYPFRFEGHDRHLMADGQLASIQKYCDETRTLYNDNCCDPGMSLAAHFDNIDKDALAYIEGFIHEKAG